MTTGRPPGTPAGSDGTDAPLPQDGESAATAPNGDVPAASRPADAQTGPPSDVQELRQEIEHTREQLGETIEQLVAKADVKARARDTAAGLVGQIKGKTGQARTQAAERAGKLRDQLASETGTKRHRLMSLGSAAKEQFPGRVAAVVTPVWEATPEPARQAVAKGAGAARQRRAPLAVAAGVLTAVCLAIRWWRRR